MELQSGGREPRWLQADGLGLRPLLAWGRRCANRHHDAPDRTIGCRSWRGTMQPRHDNEGGCAVNPDDYHDKRQGLKVGAHRRF